MTTNTGPISREELAHLLKASKKSKMCEILHRSKIRFVLDANGYPALTWESLNMQLSSCNATNEEYHREDGFTLEAI